jgi:hypothetical protein
LIPKWLYNADVVERGGSRVGSEKANTLDVNFSLWGNIA